MNKTLQRIIEWLEKMDGIFVHSWSQEETEDETLCTSHTTYSICFSIPNARK